MNQSTQQVSLIGKRLPRLDGPVKASGGAEYTGDLKLPGMLHGKILFSIQPHARILNIDMTRALRLPGVKAVITGKDTIGEKYGNFRRVADEQGLATDKVRFIGDAVAAVAAIDEDVAEEALSLIDVDYESLPAVFDPEEALAPGAPIIHDRAPDNVSWKCLWRYGDGEAALETAYHVREDTFVTPAISPASLERHVSLAAVDGGGRLTVWTCAQSPYLCRRNLAIALGMGEGDIRLIKPYVGGGFGGKVELFSHQFCSALMAQRTGRPVRIELSREETFWATRHRHPMVIHLKTGVSRDGTLAARSCRLIADGGAYTSTGLQALYLAGTFMHLPYRLPHIHFEARRAFTNKPISGPVRGHGTIQPYFATESQMDLLAEDLGLDPLEIRARNAIPREYLAANGLQVTSSGFKQCMSDVVTASGWGEKRRGMKAHSGIGIGCGSFISGATIVPGLPETAIIKINYDGVVTLSTGASDVGQGSDTVLVQIAAEELGLRIEDIRLVTGDTDVAPIDPGTYSSRVTVHTGNAVKRAAVQARHELLELAARVLEANPGDLEARDRRFYVRGSPQRGIAFVDLVRKHVAKEHMPIIATGRYKAALQLPNLDSGYGNASPSYSFGAQVAETAVDPETGQVSVLQVTSAHDCGKALNPMAVEGQMEGSVHMGLGFALLESLQQIDGQTTNASLLDYKMPTAMDMPEVRHQPVEEADQEGPYGAKEAGEGTVSPTASAIANALAHALGVRLRTIPFSPEQILAALEDKEK